MTHREGNTLYYQPDSWGELANKIPPHPETGLDWLRSEELREAEVSWLVWCSTERKYCVRLPWDRNVTRTCWFGPPSAAASCDGFLFDASEKKMKRRKMKRRKGDDRSSHSLGERFCFLQAYLWTSWNTLFWADERLLRFLCFPVLPGRQPHWSDTAVTHAQPPHSLILQSLPLWFPWGKNWSPLLCYFNSFSEEGITAPPGRGMEVKIRWGWRSIAALIHRTAACMLQAAFLHTSLLTSHKWLTVIILWQRDSIATAKIQLLPPSRPLSLVEDIVF